MTITINYSKQINHRKNHDFDHTCARGELKLSPEAKKQFEKSVSIIKDMINKLEDNPAQILNLDRKR